MDVDIITARLSRALESARERRFGARAEAILRACSVSPQNPWRFFRDIDPERGRGSYPAGYAYGYFTRLELAGLIARCAPPRGALGKRWYTLADLPPVVRLYEINANGVRLSVPVCDVCIADMPDSDYGSAMGPTDELCVYCLDERHPDYRRAGDTEPAPPHQGAE